MLRQAQLEAAVDKAIAYFEACGEPQALLWLALMHRRFGIAAFSDALPRFDALLARGPDQAARLRVFRRIADRDNPLRPEDLQAVTHPSDLIVAYALYADCQPLPPIFAKALQRAAGQGGYYLTHVLLAWVWARENGCEPILPDGFLDEVFRANAAIVNADTGLVSDLRLEAAAFLHLAGQGALVDSAFVETVLVTQNSDGGWGRSRDQSTSDWHATVLGLLLLLFRHSSPEFH